MMTMTMMIKGDGGAVTKLLKFPEKKVQLQPKKKEQLILIISYTDE